MWGEINLNCIKPLKLRGCLSQHVHILTDEDADKTAFSCKGLRLSLIAFSAELASFCSKKTDHLHSPSASFCYILAVYVSSPLCFPYPPSLFRMNQLTWILDPIPLFCTCILWTVLYLKNKKAKQNKNIQLSSLFTLKTVPSRSWVVGTRHSPCHSRSLERLPDFSKHI